MDMPLYKGATVVNLKRSRICNGSGNGSEKSREQAQRNARTATAVVASTHPRFAQVDYSRTALFRSCTIIFQSS